MIKNEDKKNPIFRENIKENYLDIWRKSLRKTVKEESGKGKIGKKKKRKRKKLKRKKRKKDIKDKGRRDSNEKNEDNINNFYNSKMLSFYNFKYNNNWENVNKN